jgi:hypothetical protein
MTPALPSVLRAPTPAHLPVDVESAAAFIAAVQKPNGEIPWSIGGKTDPWDHVESAMGLDVAGNRAGARRAYDWSLQNQLSDGSWWSEYREGRPAQDAYKDPNMTAYIAVGVLHHFLICRDRAFLSRMWDCVQGAMNFVIGLQRPEGQIPWALRADGSLSARALLTGSSSIYMSLRCAEDIASALGEKRPGWREARLRLGEAIRLRPHLFDSTKARFSMDWYYPVLCSAVTGKEAQRRIATSWRRFAVPGWGVRCVSDRPWATMAETAELALTLAAIGRYDAAETVMSWLADKKYADGAFWTGVTFPEGVIYTTEKTAWTVAAVLLAADSLYGLTPASGLFRHEPARELVPIG